MKLGKSLQLILALALTGLAVTTASAQQAPASPRQTAEATVGGGKVTIDYGAPSVRGRQIFGGLVPYGKVWRLGANKATHLTTETDLMIGTLAVPKGTYTLYALPGDGAVATMQLIVSRQTGQWGTVYAEAQDLGRVAMKVSKAATPVEQMKLSISGGNLVFEWDTVRATVPVSAKK